MFEAQYKEVFDEKSLLTVKCNELQKENDVLQHELAQKEKERYSCTVYPM